MPNFKNTVSLNCSESVHYQLMKITTILIQSISVTAIFLCYDTGSLKD